MKLNIYSIYDVVAQVFNKPFTDINDGTAVRSFVQSVNDQPHKNDYVLYKLGSLTDHNGVIEPSDVPIKIHSGFDIKSADLGKATAADVDTLMQGNKELKS